MRSKICSRKHDNFEMAQIVEDINKTGGFNPYDLSWGEEVTFPSTRKIKEYGNRIYNRYPARSIFLVPRAILYHQKRKGLNVLDPFMGSGTTAVETILSGNNALGLEMDPFARLISDVSSTVFNREQLEELNKYFNIVLSTWKSFEADSVPDLAGIRRWFKTEDFNELLQLKACILSTVPVPYLNFFLVVYADCIKPVSKMERQSLKPYISSKYTKVTQPVQVSFEHSYSVHYNAASEMSLECPGENLGVDWVGFDATTFKAQGIDLAITSPPYINALDYTRCVKVEGAMVGYITDDIAKEMRGMQIGHENRKKDDATNAVMNEFGDIYARIASKDKNRAKTCLSYFNDIYDNLQCVYNSLVIGGEYHIIIGDNTIKGIPVPTHAIIAELAKSIGFEWFGYYKYKIKDHRTSIPRANKAQKIEYEYVLMLKKR